MISRASARRAPIRASALRKAERAAREDTAPLQAVPPADATALPQGYALVRHDEIHQSKLNPRKHFVDAEVEEMAADIAIRGLLGNLVVRPRPGGRGYELAAGEKRWRAIGELIKDRRTGVADPFNPAWTADKLILVQVRELTDAQLVALALSENYRRSNPNHLEIGAAFAQLMELEKITAKDVALRHGYAATTVQQHVKAFREAKPADRKAYLAGQIDWKDLRERVQNPPPPPPEELVLTPAQQLLIAEVAHASGFRNNQHYYSAIEVGPEANTEGWGVLRDKNLIQPPWVGQYGRRFLQLGYNGGKWVDRNFPGLGSAEERDAALEELQDRLSPGIPVFPIPGATYLTSCLNGPFPLSAEAQAAKDANEAEIQRLAQERLQRETRKRDTMERCRLALGDADRAAQEISAGAARKAEPVHAMLAELVATTGRKFPFRMAGVSMVDADDEVVVQGHEGEDWLNVNLRWRLLTVALNAAAGFATPGEETPAEDDEEANPALLRLAGVKS